ncbi:MAG: CHC2 zinc finger domain-containing protein [Armatimonadota bacterium]
MPDAKDYYRQLREVDIGPVARELLAGRITQDDRHALQCDCPRHQSQSHRSLQVFVDKQSWYCFGCGVGGDVLQLVEFVQSGHVTRGQSGTMPESHRRARDFLAARVGLPPLSDWGRSPEQIAQTEAAHQQELRVYGILTELGRYYHRRLRADPRLLAWVKERYGFGDDCLQTGCIGFAGAGTWEEDGKPQPGPVRHLATLGYTEGEIASSGAFVADHQDNLWPFFDGRITFPYWRGGRVVYLIGRKTPWTPAKPWESAKYKKLPIHDEHGRKHIAPCIDNSVLFNEDVLLSSPERLIITEGVADAISLMQAGFPVISPVTVHIRQADWERLVPRLKGIKTIYLCQDNEISEAGLKGALRTAQTLKAQGIDTRLVALPLEEKHVAARQQLAERFGLGRGVTAQQLKARLEGRAPEEIKEAEALLSAAKIDVNDYFREGRTAEEFEALLSAAQSPLEFAIGRLPLEVSEEQRNRLLTPVLDEIALLSPLGQTRHLKALQERFGKEALPVTALRQQLKEIQRQHKRQEKERRKKEQHRPTAPEGTCQAAVQMALLETKLLGGAPDYGKAAEAAYQWLVEHGARFFHTPAGEPFCFLGDSVYWMDSPDRNRRRLYAACLYEHTGQSALANGGRIFFDVLASLAVQRGEVKERFGWLHSDLDACMVYFHLGPQQHQLVKIGPAGAEMIPNGGNPEGIILEPAPKLRPIRYLPDVDLAEADRLFEELIIRNLTCSQADRYFISAWVNCFLLLDFVGTRPSLRLEGPTGRAKTVTAKHLSMYVYGQLEHKLSTTAANFVDGSRNPLLLLDNIEVKDANDDLIQFLVTAVTGISKEKRRAGTDSETVTEATKCLLCTTGVEPLGGDLSEVLSRSFVIKFDGPKQGRPAFLETVELNRIAKHRDLLLSALLKRTSLVLAMLKEGAQARVMELLHEALGDHPKRRCNEYLSLMYLMMLVGGSREEVEEGLRVLHPRFVEMIASLNSTTQETARESNAIATTLNTLFRAWEQASAADAHLSLHPETRVRRDGFLERYQLQFGDDGELRGVLARDLFVALRRVAREFNLTFAITSVQQFAQRFANDLPAIQDAGFAVTINEHRSRVRTYDIARVSRIDGAEQ